MAITAEQAAAISTAIENLNRSVQVNEEVLNIIKSMQSTGAAGNVAEHAADKNAHPELNRLMLHRNLVVVPEYKGSLGNTPYYVELFSMKDSAGNGGSSAMHICGTPNSISADPVSLRIYTNTPDLSASDFLSQSLGSFHFAVRYLENASIKALIKGSISCSNDDQGNARLFLDVKDKSGTNNQYWFRHNSFTPSASIDLGSPTYQWKDLYLQNSPIVSSDRRLKQDFSEVPEAVFKAWANVKFCQYRFKEAVEEKSGEARLHVGLIAQEILEAFKAQGLDATAYGIVCHDSWEDQYQDVEVGTKPAILNEKGEVIKPEEPIMERQLSKPAGDLWTVRYEEALALEAAYQRWKLQKIEAALKAKGIEL